MRYNRADSKAESGEMMDSYEAIRDIYVHMQDEVSKFIFLKRLEYSLSGKNDAIEEIVTSEMERYGMEDLCVYHKPEDIMDIPQKILEMNPEYKFYLRHYSYTNTETVLYAV